MEFEMPDPQEEPGTYVPTKMTPEETEKFAKSDIDGLPYRFPQIWAMADRCVAKGKDMLCPDSLKEMHNMIQDWPI